MAEPNRRQRIEQMLEQDPHDPFLRYGLGMEWVGEGDHARAAQVFLDLLKHSPDYVPAYYQGGQALIRSGHADQARGLLVRGLAAARQAGDLHAAQEIQELLASLG